MIRTVSSLAAPSLFSRVGGAPAIAQMVTSLYERVRADPELEPYFHVTDFEVQRRKLGEMLTDVLGGPQADWLLDLRTAHRGRGISHRHFSLLCAHLIDTLEAAGLTGDEADDMIEWVGQARSAVVEDRTVSRNS
jgi:truncated hemoglobin YjbI